MEKQKLLFEQSRLSDRGVAEMVLMYISASKGISNKSSQFNGSCKKTLHICLLFDIFIGNMNIARVVTGSYLTADLCVPEFFSDEREQIRRD